MSEKKDAIHEAWLKKHRPFMWVNIGNTKKMRRERAKELRK